jgi:hypothetical protein
MKKSLFLIGFSVILMSSFAQVCNPGPITQIASLPYNSGAQTTCGQVNNVTSTNASPICGSSAYYGGEDAVYTFTPTSTGPVGINVTSTGSWMGIMLYQGCPVGGGTCMGSAQSSLGSQSLCATLTAGQTYYLIIDSWPSPTCNPYTLNITGCSGAPTAGSAVASPSNMCGNYTTTLSLSGAGVSCGITYQWQSGPSSTGPWTNIAGATSATASAAVSTTTYYRCILTCNTSTAASTPATASLSASGACGICNINSVTLPFTGTGLTTCGQGNDVTSTNVTSICGSSAYYGGEDAVYSFTPGTSGPLGINVSSTGSWMGIMLYAGCPISGGTCAGSAQSSLGSQSLCVNVTAGQAYYLVIDSWPSPTCNPYNLTITGCSGAPVAGTAVASPSMMCGNYTTTLSLTGAGVNCGVTYQWQSAPSSTGPWTNIAGATSATASAAVSATTYYRCVIACSTSTAASAPATASLSAAGACGLCNINSVTLPYTASGQTTCGQGNDVTATNVSSICGSNLYYGGEDAVYSFTPSTNTTLGIDVTGTGSWMGIMLYAGCPISGGTCVGSAQSSAGSQSLCVNVVAGQAYYLVIDSWPSPTCNPYNINMYLCSGAPAGGVATASPAAACASGGTVALTVTGSVGTCGFSFQWQSAPSAAGPWTNIVGATSASYAPSITGTICFRRLTTCSTLTGTSVATCVSVGSCTSALGTGFVSVSSLPYSTSGTTCGSGDDITASNVNASGCGSTSYFTGEDQVFAFTPSTSGNITISLTSSGSYTGLMLFNGCPLSCAGGVGCVGNAQGSTGNKNLVVCVNAGTTYYLVLDSWATPTCNAYSNLSISAPGAATTATSNDPCVNPMPISPTGSFTGNTFGYTPDTPGNLTSVFCGSIENNQWYIFTATATTASFGVSAVSGTACAAGVQAQIFAVNTTTGVCQSCNSFTSMSTPCYNPGTTTAGSVTATGLTVGQQYYLMIDGNGGAQCNFTINGWSFAPLPVALINFLGTNYDAHTNQLTWRTAQETNMKKYIVQRSDNAVEFVDAGEVLSANSLKEKSYSFFDHNIYPQVNYYRLKMMNTDGTFRFSNTIAINNDPLATFNIEKVFPNPTRSKIYITLDIPRGGAVQMEILDVLGNVVYSAENTIEYGRKLLEADMEDHAKGIYYIKITFNGQTKVEKFSLQ